MKTVTIWERQNNNTKQWEHNHISEGFSEDEVEPEAESPLQKSSWKGATWRKTKGILEDGVVRESL